MTQNDSNVGFVGKIFTIRIDDARWRTKKLQGCQFFIFQ
jgi:hypothetical protein